LDALSEAFLTGSRPPNVPENWVGAPTVSSPGFRWDDPHNPGNSLRFFRANPNDPNPSHREDFVIVVRDGRVLDKDGNVIDDEGVTWEALQHT
jgi:hypothetical protein